MAAQAQDSNFRLVLEDDDNEGCDLDDDALFKFTQQECSQYEFEEDDEDHSTAPGPTDYSQEFEEESPCDMGIPTSKRRRQSDSFHDTADKYFLNVDNEQRIFKTNEFFVKNAFIYEPEVVYKIEELYTERKTRKKKAKCKLFKLARKTFIGAQEAFENTYSKYVFYRTSQNVALSDLKIRLEGKTLERFLEETTKATVFIDPPSKECKGVGWTVAYGFAHDDMKCPSKAPTFVDLFAGGGGMSLGLTKAGFRLL
jgi:hypothetical protein